MSLAAVLIIILLLLVVWPMLPAGNYPAAPNWIGAVAAVLIIVLLLKVLGLF